jgi:hypothetical protein
VVLETLLAQITASAAFNHATDTNSVTNLETFDIRSDSLYNSSNLMARSCRRVTCMGNEQ